MTLAACAEERPPPIEFPPSLEPTADGVPTESSDCRRLIVNEAVARWRDEGSSLVGCPDDESASLVPGVVVGIVDDFLIVATPHPESD